MNTNLLDAHRQWATRSPDERFSSLESLYDYTHKRGLASHQMMLTVGRIELKESGEGGINLNGHSEPMRLSNWSFGQLSAMAGAPAQYLRKLPPSLACSCLQYGLNANREECQVLIRKYNSSEDRYTDRVAAAFTSSTYGRIWDADVVESIMEAIEGTSWHVPHSSEKDESDPSGLYASDRDMFAFMVNDENPVQVGNSKLGRGFFCWNSETGSASFGISTFLYNYVCKNHIVWGAKDVNELRIIHRSRSRHWFEVDGMRILNDFVGSRSLESEIKSMATRAMETPTAKSLDEILKQYQGKQFTKKELESAWVAGQEQGEDVTTVWGMVQGLTSVARDMPHIDRRVNLERRASMLLPTNII
ncbi:MAG: DUF932 domain-containing protein [candidate division Zixibacteria bacterium]|nr:DUF932 domain-containing protein [candidate division Zixibacteria bacterium]